MDTFCSILGEEESKQIWDRINAELRFQPSVRVNQLPFQLSEPYLVLDLTYATQEQVEKLLAEVPGALAACLGEDDWIYALDWHHSCFRYAPPPAHHRAQPLGGGRELYGRGLRRLFPGLLPRRRLLLFRPAGPEMGLSGPPLAAGNLDFWSPASGRALPKAGGTGLSCEGGVNVGADMIRPTQSYHIKTRRKYKC